MIRLALLLALAGCAGPAPLPGVPAALQVCPDPPLTPPTLPRVRTVEALGAWGVASDRALRETESARVKCARIVDRLNDWIATHRSSP